MAKVWPLLLLSISSASCRGSPQVDPRLLGTWRATISNQLGAWTLVFEPDASGRYRTRVTAGPAAVPDETGTLTARDGRWHVEKDSGQTDGGSYRFLDADTVTFQGANPSVTWHRLGRPPAVASRAPEQQDAQPAPTPGPPPRSTESPPELERKYQQAKKLMEAKRYREAMPLLLDAAEHGHAFAQHQLGFIYQGGEPGIPKNEPEAARWYARAAAQGNRASQYALGGMYEEGEGGLARDSRKAADLYLASAKQGFGLAQFAYGLTCEFQLHDRPQAIRWLEQAGRQGDGRARWIAEWLRNPETPHFKDESELGAYINRQVSAWIQSAGPRRAGGGMISDYYQERAKTLYETRGKEAGDRCRFNGMCY